jgi:hypothetical protein
VIARVWFGVIAPTSGWTASAARDTASDYQTHCLHVDDLDPDIVVT